MILKLAIEKNKVNPDRRGYRLSWANLCSNSGLFLAIVCNLAINLNNRFH